MEEPNADESVQEVCGIISESFENASESFITVRSFKLEIDNILSALNDKKSTNVLESKIKEP